MPTCCVVNAELNVNETQYENVTLQEGESKTFVCSATGTPAPTVQWFFVRSVRRVSAYRYR